MLGIAAPIAQAQSLTLGTGDVVTVDGTGTHGTINNNTTSYDDTGNYYAVRTNNNAAFTLGSGGSAISNNVNIGLYATGSGPIIITGGSIVSRSSTDAFGDYAVDNIGSGPLTISGGTITSGNSGIALNATGSGTVTITGGSFSVGNNGIGLNANGSRGVSISGGSFTAGESTSAGTFVVSALGSPVTITGGTFSAGLNAYDLYAQAGGSINLYGDFIGYAPGNITLATNGAAGTFNGTLINNTVSQAFSYKNFGTIILHNVAPAAAPEPSQLAAFGIGLLGLGALALKAKRRAA